MVKSKSNKMHLEINNDVELDINNASISRRNKKSKKSSTSTIKRKNLKTPMRMLSSKPKMLAKKKRPSKRMTDKVTALKSKPMTASILIKGKRVPVKVMKMASGPKLKRVAFSASRKNASVSRRRTSISKRKASTSRREASSSRRKVSDSRRKASNSRRKASVSRRRVSDSRRKSSDSRRKASDARRKASDARRKASASRRKASDARRRASDTKRSLRPSELAKLPKIYFNFRTWSWRRDSEGDG